MQYFEAPDHLYTKDSFNNIEKKIGVLLLSYLRNSFYQLIQLEIILVFFNLRQKSALSILKLRKLPQPTKILFSFRSQCITWHCKSMSAFMLHTMPYFSPAYGLRVFFLCILIQRNFKDIVKILCIISICTSYQTHLVALVFVILFYLHYLYINNVHSQSWNKWQANFKPHQMMFFYHII